MLRLLLLEDSELDARIIAGELEAAGLSFDLVRVPSRAQFLDALELQSFDLILSDYNVPGFGGDEALALALARRPDVPFLFVSGALGEQVAIDLLKRGATDYVLKDRLERLVPSVERALRESREKLERRRAERDLQERERALSTLLGNLPGMAFRRAATRPYRIEFASEGCLSLTGYEADALCGAAEGWASLVHPDDVDRIEAIAAGASTDDTPVTLTYRIVRRGGDERWLWERSVVVARASDGAPIAVEGFATDITQHRAAEEELRRRVEFEQQLIGIVSHDLRNPLSAITLGASLLLRREGLSEASTRAVRRIVSSAERAGRLIRDLLDFTRARSGEGLPIAARALALAPLAEGVLEEFEHSHPTRSIDLHVAGDDQLEGDADRLAQVLTNLLGNALAYSPPDSRVTFRVEGEPDHVRIEIHNSGEPIAEDRLPELFKPYRRATTALRAGERSVGLGLFIVDAIVRAHGGAIDVRSDRERGTTFTVRLPRRIAQEGRLG